MYFVSNALDSRWFREKSICQTTVHYEFCWFHRIAWYCQCFVWHQWQLYCQSVNRQTSVATAETHGQKLDSQSHNCNKRIEKAEGQLCSLQFRSRTVCNSELLLKVNHHIIYTLYKPQYITRDVLWNESSKIKKEIPWYIFSYYTVVCKKWHYDYQLKAATATKSEF